MPRVNRSLLARLSLAAAVGGILPHAAEAQAPAQRVFVQVNLGVPLPATRDFTQSATVPFSDEVMSHQSRYQAPAGLFLDGGGGYRFSRRVGAGISISRSGGSKAAAFSLTRPNPLVYDSLLTRDSTSRSLDQVQRSVHLSVVLTPEFGRAYDLTLVAGPSRIYVDQELITGVEISETLDGGQYDFAINRPLISDGKVCACAWGFHVGADASRFPTNTFGVGAMIRYSRARVDLQNAAQIAVGADPGTTAFTAGGFTVAAGIRMRMRLGDQR